MATTLIGHEIDLTADHSEGLVILPPATEDTRLKMLNVKWKFHEQTDGNFPVVGFPTLEPTDTTEFYALKAWWVEWENPHVRLDLMLLKPGGDEVTINSVPLVNRNFPFDRDLISNVATNEDVFFDVPIGHGLKVYLIDNGFGIPNSENGNYISIVGIGTIGSDKFTAPVTNINASTSVTNTADGKTIKSGMLPKAGWEISGSESAPWAQGATYYEYGQGDLLYLIDGDDSTKWESSTPGNSHDKRIRIHLGKEYQINGIRIKTGDFPHKMKGQVLVSTDMGTWREVYPTGFLEGDINFAKVAARWVSIECKVTDNTPYSTWHLYEVTLFGDITQDTEVANNPIISPLGWGIEHMYWGSTGSSSPSLNSEPVERIEADTYLTISPDSNGLPQLNYEPFNTVFSANYSGNTWTPSEKMTQEFSGIEIDLKKNYNIELIDAQFATTPKQWRGHLLGSKDKNEWIILASGFISELRAQAVNFTQCRFLRLRNDPQANSLNGFSTPPRLNKLSIYASLSMQQIDPHEPPATTTMSSLNPIIWLKDGSLVNNGNLSGSFTNNGVGSATLNSINTFSFSSGYLIFSNANFESPESLGGIALVKVSAASANYHGIIDILGVLTYEITPDPNRKASVLRKDNGSRTGFHVDVLDNPFDTWMLVGWEVNFTSGNVKLYSGGQYSNSISLSIPSPSTGEVVVGYYHPNQEGYLQGEIAELLVFPSLLPVDMSGIISELNAKWGLSL